MHKEFLSKYTEPTSFDIEPSLAFKVVRTITVISKVEWNGSKSLSFRLLDLYGNIRLVYQPLHA